MPSVFIALGSNIDPEDNLKAAATMIRGLFPSVRYSSVFKTAPLLRADQADFLNAAATLESDESPDEIQNHLKFIELRLKKAPPFRFGPRTIDLDLLLYGDQILPDAERWKILQQGADATTPLALPHLHMHERRFVLEPLIELLDPASLHPVLGQSWKALLAQTHDQKIEQMRITL